VLKDLKVQDQQGHKVPKVPEEPKVLKDQ
jgi:hypothetical protein